MYALLVQSHHYWAKAVMTWLLSLSDSPAYYLLVWWSVISSHIVLPFAICLGLVILVDYLYRRYWWPKHYVAKYSKEERALGERHGVQYYDQEMEKIQKVLPWITTRARKIITWPQIQIVARSVERRRQEETERKQEEERQNLCKLLKPGLTLGKRR